MQERRERTGGGPAHKSGSRAYLGLGRKEMRSLKSPREDRKAKHSPTNDWDTNAVWIDAGRGGRERNVHTGKQISDLRLAVASEDATVA